MTFEDLFQTVASAGGEISLRFGPNPYPASTDEMALRIDVTAPGEKRLTIQRVMLSSRGRRPRGVEEMFHLRDAVNEIGDVVAQRAVSPSRVVSVLLGERQERGE